MSRYYNLNPVYDCNKQRAEHHIVRIAGTCDLVGTLNGKKYLIDLKTSKGFYEPSMPAQVAAYAEAFDDIEGIGVLRLDKETGMPEFKDYTRDRTNYLFGFLHLTVIFWMWYIKKRRQDGDIPSVTTILDILDKPALVQWAANCTILYLHDHIEEISGTVDDAGMKDIFNAARRHYKEISKTALDIGSRTHGAIESFLKDEPYTLDEDTDKPFHAFLQWAVDNDFHKIATEQTVTIEVEMDTTWRIGRAL